MSTSQDILIDITQGVMTLTLNRLEKKNAFTRAMYRTCATALAQAAQSEAVRVVVVQGHATVFSAGNDIEEFLASSQTAVASASPQTLPPESAFSPAPAAGHAVVDTTADAADVLQFLKALATFPKPLVAAVCGPAVGIGTTLLFHCDLVYAGDNAAFSMPFVNLGLCPEAASSLLVPQMLGYHRACEALMLGEPFMAEAALEVGLVNRVVPPTEAHGVAQAQARKLAAKPLQSLLQTKRLMKRHSAAQVLAALDEEAHTFACMLREPAAQEAFGAFLDKRKPDFNKL